MTSANESTGPRTRPADGERRAVRNLSAQYKVAATLVYDALLRGELEWVRLVDPDAGRLDDVLIARPGRLDAYQIKWSDYRQPVTFRDLVTESKVSGKAYPAPIALMADGWTRLSALYPDRRIHAHYLMHDAASSSDGKVGPGQGDPPHLQSFLRNAFPKRADWFAPDSTVYPSWSAKIDALTAAAAIPQKDFERFIVNIELDLGFDLSDCETPARLRRANDIDLLAAFFMQEVANSTQAVELRRGDILRNLGWNDRFEFRFKHDFPVDDRLYQPIEQTVASLDEALKQFQRGYIALVGPPGSGKSTTLTQTLRYRNGVRLVRYYAFVRDDPRSGRGEATAFLHDLCLALEALGVGETGHVSPLPSSLQELHDRMGLQLAALGREAQADGIRTIILIDGLDHIEREQNPERSLIDELPAPANVPDGVLFVLGTQQTGLDGPSPVLRPIRAQLAAIGRKIIMSPLSRLNVQTLVCAAVPKELRRAGDEELIYQRSAGHPLSLAYLVKQLAGATDLTAASALLDEGMDYGGDTDAEYAAYWDRLADDADLRQLLGLLSRLRGTIDLATIKNFADAVVTERFVKSAFYLFRELSKSRWAFFHNSFRQFVLRKTRLDAFGQPDAARDLAFHQQLATAALQPDASAELRWESLYHLEKAGNLTALVNQASQAWFREQYFSGRPLADILEDIRLAMRATVPTQDVVAVAGLLLVNKELEERQEALDQISVTELQLELADDEAREGLLMLGSDVLVSPKIALIWSRRLFENGNTALAFKIFEAAEPVELLGGLKQVLPRGDDFLDAWASVAWRFRSLDQIFQAVENLTAEPEHTVVADTQAPDTAKDQYIRQQILAQIGTAMQEAGDAAAYAALVSRLQSTDAVSSTCLVLDFRTAHRAAGNLSVVDDPVAAMKRVLAASPPNQTTAADAALFADALVRMPALTEEADAYLNVIQGTLARAQLDPTEEQPFRLVAALFQQARAAAARGRPIDPLTIANPERDWDLGRVLFQRLVVLVGTLAGEALAGTNLTPEAFLRRLTPLLIFRRSYHNKMIDWHDSYAIRGGLNELWKRALSTAEAHGRAVFIATITALNAEWARQPKHHERPWSSDTRRQIIMHAYTIDRDAVRTEKSLQALDDAIDPTWELHERLEELKSAASAWASSGHRYKARAALNRLLTQSFGIHYRKDHQIEDWVKWAARLIEAEPMPQIIEGAVEKLLKLLALLFEAHRGRGAPEATGELIEAIARRWPEQARIAGEWLLDEGVGLRRTVLGAILAADLRSGDPRRVTEALTATGRLIVSVDGYEDQTGKAIAALVNSPLARETTVAKALADVRHVAEALGGSPLLVTEILGTTMPLPKRAEKSDRIVGLVTVDGTTLSQADLTALAAQPAKLSEALENAQSEYGVDWVPVMDALFVRKAHAAFSQAASVIAQRSLSGSASEHLVSLAVKAGETELAEQMIQQLIAQGRPQGWSRFYDGGSRFPVSRSMRLLDPTGGRRRALSLFVNDFTSGEATAGNLIMYLDVILAEFVNAIPVPNVWAEIEEHLSMLVDLRENKFQPPSLDLSSTTPASINPARLLLREMDALPSALAWEARKGLIDILMQGDPTQTVQRGLRTALSGSLRDQAAALATIHGLVHLQADLAFTFVPNVEALAWADSGVIRLAAQKILFDLHRPLPAPPAPKPLPAIYRLEVPEVPQTDVGLRGGISLPGEPLPDTQDPYDLTTLYHPALKQMAKHTGFSFDLLVRRMAQHPLTIVPPESWSAAEEVRLRDLNKETGVRLSYRRPRGLVMQHAFGLLVSELCDGGALSWPAWDVEYRLTVADPIINMHRPKLRPVWVDVPKGQAIGKHPVEAWLDSAVDALPTLEVTPDGWVVLGELTSIVSQGRYGHEENRLSVLAHRQLAFNPERAADIYELWHEERYAASDYPDLLGFTGKIPTSVVAGGSMLAASQFIALSPLIGARLGWRMSSEGLFRWVDDAGQIMAESISWADGNTEVYDSGDLYALASRGWLVLATPAGWFQIRPLIKNFVRHRKADRQSGFDRADERRMETAKDEIDIPA